MFFLPLTTCVVSAWPVIFTYTSKVCTDLKVGGWSPRDFKGLTVIFIIFYKVQLINETNNEWMGMGAGPLIYFIYIKRGPLLPPPPQKYLKISTEE